ncbi:hypothetical protein GOODEAATRI_023505 [Goodea atripinnis]|uniref:Uncharacterized protein n=1 Tax=Goodea atripinnis TaxID=208336 RepID=A0ABV0PR53_9TELE
MKSLGKTSKWPSYDSLPSTSSFPPSENEQTEDEADIFSEGEGDGGLKNSLHPEFNGDQCVLYPDEAKHLSPEGPALRSSLVTPGDLIFAEKVRTLAQKQVFSPSGFFARLSEKYLQNLLQIEMLLKTWFPQTSFKYVGKSKPTSTPTLASYRRKNQLHIPVKKRKLSWSDPDVADRVPAKQSHRQHREHESCHAATSLDTASTCLPLLPENQTTAEEKTAKAAVDDCPASQRFTDRTCSLGRSYLCSSRENENQKLAEIFLPSSCGSPATQDCSVSSSNSFRTTDSS